MREKNGFGSSVGTIQRFSRLTDLLRMPRSSSVYQCPGSAGLADEVHIRDADRQTEDIERNFLQWHSSILCHQNRPSPLEVEPDSSCDRPRSDIVRSAEGGDEIVERL